MSKSKNTLPTISKAEQPKDCFRIQDMLQKRRCKGIDYRLGKDFVKMKANNFIAHLRTLDEPSVIFSICDQIKKEEQRIRDQPQSVKTQCCDSMSLSKKGDRPSVGSTTRVSEQKWARHRKQCNERETRSPRVSFLKKSASNSFYNNRYVREERKEVLDLAKWIDSKMAQFKQKNHVTLMDIVDYKQTVLNYGLGMIMDLVSRKCREEGDMLRFIWENTFAIFEDAFSMMASAAVEHEKSRLNEAAELQSIFNCNNNYLKEANAQIKQENTQIFEKMKKVILWNKRLRRERKKQDLDIRILEYRNITYAQALEETVQLLLRSAPESGCIDFAKKIIVHLAREKRGKKKGTARREVDEEMRQEAREMVYSWLKRNSLLEGEELEQFKDLKLNNDEKIMINELEDRMQMEKVDIYDFFRMIDVGSQATAQVTNVIVQANPVVTYSINLMTDPPHCVQQGVQTVFQPDKPDQKTIMKHSLKFSQPAKSVHKTAKNAKEKDKRITTVKIRESNLGRELKQNIAVHDIKIHNKHPKEEAKESKKEALEGREIDTHIKSMSSSQNGDQQADEQSREVSVEVQLRKTHSKRQMIEVKRANSKIRHNHSKALSKRASVLDFMESHMDEQKGLRLPMHQYRKRQNRRSVSFMKAQNNTMRFVDKLQLRKFAEIYKQSKEKMEQNRKQFYDQIVQRRSFYMKMKVEFANSAAAEESHELRKNVYRGQKEKTILRSQFQDTYVHNLIERATKKMSFPVNIDKTKTLWTQNNTFQAMALCVEPVARAPPKNPQFFSNSLINLSKYVSSLLADYVRQIRREKEEIPNYCEKACYPLNILLMERMTFKYGLKDIAEKKIKDFIEKVRTFAPVSEKVALYSLLLGLEKEKVGTDELLVYLRCLVYLQNKKAMKDVISQKNYIDMDIVKQNIPKVLDYFFDASNSESVEEKIVEHMQQNSPHVTVEQISLVLIQQLIVLKEKMRQKYTKIYQLCSSCGSFATILYKLMKMVYNYGPKIASLKSKKGSILKAEQPWFGQQTPQIMKISKAIKEVLRRSDLVEEYNFRSISEESFLAVCIVFRIPTLDLLRTTSQSIMAHARKLNGFSSLQPSLETCIDNNRYLDELSRKWNTSRVKRLDDTELNEITFCGLFCDRTEKVLQELLGKLGIIGSECEAFLFAAA